MTRYERVEVLQNKIVEFKCDVCGRDLLSDPCENEEALLIRHTGGYASIFGDGVEITLDLCQHCFNEKLGAYCTINGKKRGKICK